MGNPLEERTLTPEQAAEVERIIAERTAECPRPPRVFDVADSPIILRFRTADLPEAQPHIWIDPRWSEDDE